MVRDRIENFWNSLPGVFTQFAIVLVIYGSIHFFYQGGVLGFIKNGTTFSLTLKEVPDRAPSQ